MKTNNKPEDKPIVIGSGTESVYYCSICSRRLISLKGGQYECGYCGIKITPDNLNTRVGKGITTREGFSVAAIAQPEEPAVSTTPGIPDISIRHEKQLRGGFAELQRKGLKITNYNDSGKYE